MIDEMSCLLSFLKSTVGQKIMMSVTGVILFGFVVGHMLGNLLVFKGPDALNAYAEFLHAKPAMLWGARIVLLSSLLIHVGAALALAQLAREARPVGYARHEMIATNFAARTMRQGGIIILLFVGYHLLHLTFGVVGPEHMQEDVYRNVVSGFQSPIISGVYILAMLALGLHLFHGLWSLFQTLGLNHPRYNNLRRCFSAATALAICAGNIAIPVAILSGYIS